MAAPQLKKVVVNDQETMIPEIASMKIWTEKGISFLNYSM